MDTQDILDAALRLAKQSEIPSDTTINVPAKNVRRALFGIDVEAADLWIAKEKGYDVVIAHHPTGGSATLDFPKVLVKHADILARHGVPRPVADAAVREMQEDREQRAHAENYDRLPSIARLIGIGLMCIHNPCDEIGRRVMDETLRAKLKPNPRVRDAIDSLYTIPEFQAVMTSTVRWRNSVVAEVLLIALVYGVGILVIWRHYTALDAASWYATPSATGPKASLAGLWYGYVSLPLFQFLLLRWYYRLGLWVRFLWKVSRIRLDLVPTHPDRVGGLGFLAGTAYAFSLIAIAHGALLAGQLANRIFFLGATLTDYKMPIALMVMFLVVVFLGPLTVFAGQLTLAKQKGLREYGTLAERYVRDFDGKWLRGAAGDEPFMGSADIQSLADLGNGYAVVKEMRLAPVTKEAVFQLAMMTVAPIAPLLLTIMPLEELLKTLAGVLF